LWQDQASALEISPAERLRLRIELAVTSVLLDAGAGSAWRYSIANSGQEFARSEGLAIASLELFMAGGFSSDPHQPRRADAAGLQEFTPARLATAFQVSESNPLDGLAGRAALLTRLGQVVADRADIFGETAPRVGNLADYWARMARDGELSARTILVTLLDAFGPIWPGRESLVGRSLGDTWHHPKASIEGAANGLVPFHKLSQWLTYSLFEPLEEFGLHVTHSEALTGLAEYRNGGLFVDTGVLQLRDQAAADRPHAPDSELVVEWRALTICLLDEVAILVRECLGKSADELPLASILEGGTWAAGRRLAGARRPGGAPPIAIISDGSVF
ncbi:MAG: URC4/urg3 family protein, partial [Hyphomicrobiales bacterium]|nr:URC4/urg3 family protein [Hyphomicrobiales bacterium]